MAASISEASTPAGASSTADFDLGDLFTSAINQFASALVAETASPSDNAVQGSDVASATDSPTPTTTNALSVLESALPTILTSGLPSSVVAQIASQLSIIDGVSSSPSRQTQQSASESPSRTQKSHQSTDRPTKHPTDRPTKNPMHRPTRRPHDTHTRRPHMPHTSRPTTISTSTTSSTISSTLSSITTTGNPQNTGAANATQEHIVGSHPLPNASVAGIASGLSAGAILAGIAGLYIWRRKSQGKPIFRSAPIEGAGDGRVYPEVAWLYDPVTNRAESPDPSQTRSRGDSNANLIPAVPDPRPGSVEMEAVEFSPNLRPGRASSPLLAPEIRISRDESPSGSYGRPSEDNLRLPLRGRSDDQGA